MLFWRVRWTSAQRRAAKNVLDRQKNCPHYKQQWHNVGAKLQRESEHPQEHEHREDCPKQRCTSRTHTVLPVLTGLNLGILGELPTA
jgi:hypothetical protein